MNIIFSVLNVLVLEAEDSPETTELLFLSAL